MAEKKSKFTFGGCLGTITGMAFSSMSLLVIGYLLYKAWLFVAVTDLMNRLSNVFIGLGMCVGIVILALFVLTKIPESWFGKYTDDWN